MASNNDFEDLVALVLGLIGGLFIVALIRAIFSPRCPICNKSITRGIEICPYCNSDLRW